MSARLVALVWVVVLVSSGWIAPCARPEDPEAPEPRLAPRRDGELWIWAFGDAHVGTDIRRTRESLADAIRQSEGQIDGLAGFPWDIAIDVGDNSGGQAAPRDDEGRELVRQFGALRHHRREQIYDICGNHDRSRLDEPEAWWFRRWVDPMGENTAHSQVDAGRRPYAVAGTWERYSFRVGNILFLMMSDINEPTQKIGRGPLGGNPGGVVRRETFEWWKTMVESHPEAIVVSAHHYMLKNTTLASGAWEGVVKKADGGWTSGYHGYKEQGTPEGASYLYWVGGVRDAQAFERYLESGREVDAPAGSGAIAVWLGGHTHGRNPDDVHGGKRMIETRWGVNFVNVSALTKHHCTGKFCGAPMSRVLVFTEGSDEVRVKCFLHTDDYAPRGWYDKAEQVLRLPRQFRRD